MNKKLGTLVLTVAIVIRLAGCGKKDDKKNIIGIWQFKYALVNNIDVNDGKAWIHFKEGGGLETRTGPQMYDEGKFEIYPEKGELAMNTDSSSQRYTYKLEGDSLTLKTELQPGMMLEIKSYRVGHYPIQRIDDIPPDKVFGN